MYTCTYTYTYNICGSLPEAPHFSWDVRALELHQAQPDGKEKHAPQEAQRVRIQHSVYTHTNMHLCIRIWDICKKGVVAETVINCKRGAT
jgi:hypothetical protein